MYVIAADKEPAASPLPSLNLCGVLSLLSLSLGLGPFFSPSAILQVLQDYHSLFPKCSRISQSRSPKLHTKEAAIESPFHGGRTLNALYTFSQSYIWSAHIINYAPSRGCWFLGDDHAQISLPFRLLSLNEPNSVSSPGGLGRRKRQLSFNPRNTILLYRYACLHTQLRLGRGSSEVTYT